MLLAAGCSHHSAARLPAGPSPPARIGSTETGIASWYGVPYHGRPSASGEIFDMEKLTAAHRVLPFQTWVEVTNLSNGRQVDVRITDRGPFVGGRIIDLSMAAARELDMVRSGTAQVRLKVIPPPANNIVPVIAAPVKALENPPDYAQIPAGGYAVQAGAFSDPDRAEAFRQGLAYPDARLIQPQEGSSLWRVWVGRALTQQAATALAAQLAKTTGQGIVVRDVVRDDATQ
ncbi:MAG TPA: septal ring lytic transglycosylase RlpA family protein [Bryobacteraceae bacterium]